MVGLTHMTDATLVAAGHRMNMPVFETEEILGLRVHRVDRTGLFDTIAAAIANGKGGMINDVNVHAANLAQSDPEFRHILNHSDLIFVDGAGIMLGARLLGKTLGERLTYADWMDELFARCASENWSIFFLGDTDAIGDAFAAELARRHPGCRFAGRHHGFFDRQNAAENQQVIDQINASGADILLVGMSMPIQEKWVWAHRQSLKPAVTLTCGGFPRVYIGDIPRGPRWMTDNGLEWVYRLCMQPKVWRRYLLGNPLFLYRICKQKLLGGGEVKKDPN